MATVLFSIYSTPHHKSHSQVHWLYVNTLRSAFWIQSWMWTLFLPPLASNLVHKNITFAYPYCKQWNVLQRGAEGRRNLSGGLWKVYWKEDCSGHQKMKQVFDSQVSEGILGRGNSLRQVQEAWDQKVTFSWKSIEKWSSSQNPWRQEWQKLLRSYPKVLSCASQNSGSLVGKGG